MDLTTLLPAAVPLLGVLSRLLYARFASTSWREVERRASLRGNVDETARDSLDDLIRAQVAHLVHHDKARIGRKVDGSSVAALIFITLVTAAVTWWMLTLATWWGWVILVVVLLVYLALFAAGIADLYKDPEGPSSD